MKLNDDQKLLAELNHNLIYKFIYHKNLNVSDWYGFLAEILCLTVVDWDESRGKLSTFYYTNATNALNNEFRNKNTEKRGSNTYQITMDEDAVGDPTNHIELSDMVSTIRSCDESMSDIIDLLLQGYTRPEISELLNIPKSTLCVKIQNLKKTYERKTK